jgi:hypothetical protein
MCSCAFVATKELITEMALETLAHYRHLIQLIAREDFIEFQRY